MKLINLITLNGFFNYGNRLQLFALSKSLTDIIDGKVDVYWPRRLCENIKNIVKYNSFLRMRYKKEVKLRKFTRKRIPKATGNCDADYLIVGSDQVWNPSYYKNRKYLLDIPSEGKKTSYAASLGVDKLSNKQKEEFRRALKKYDYISVREKSAKDLLQPLVDKEIEVVLDPTLLLDVSEYEKLEKKPRNIKKGEKYILCYILGGREQMKAIEDYASKNNCKIILFSDKKESTYGVEEFLYLIHHAELICTDSFHACVFSFIFEKPFVAFKRTGIADYMYTRLQNLIETFELEGREFNGKNITSENVKADYSEAKKILKKEQKKSIEFLKNALEVCDE